LLNPSESKPHPPSAEYVTELIVLVAMLVTVPCKKPAPICDSVLSIPAAMLSIPAFRPPVPIPRGFQKRL
jgi:hypothetical protein